jgi:hypothetical protein
MDTPHLAAGRFGAPIPSFKDVVKVGENEYIDKHGNKFSGDTIRMNEHYGGGMERVSASMFDDPLGLNDTEDEDSHCDVCGDFHEDCECNK